MENTITVHLPGLLTTINYPYDSKLSTAKLIEILITLSGQEERRCKIFKCDFKSELAIPINEKTSIKTGDTLILCVRGTTDGDNTYYKTQNDVLENNKCLNPPLSSEIAEQLLESIYLNFATYGHKHFLPGENLEDLRTGLYNSLEKAYKVTPRPACDLKSAPGVGGVRKRKTTKRIRKSRNRSRRL